MTLDQFVKELPEGLVYGPIYRKGAPMISGRAATGKNPLEDSWERKYGPADVALAIKRNPDLQAVGLWSGIRGNGIVILDVDANHKRWAREWGDSLNGAPCITSTRPNAAKYLFRIPEELWGDVKGHGLRKDDGHSQGDYETFGVARASYMAHTPAKTASPSLGSTSSKATSTPSPSPLTGSSLKCVSRPR